MSDTALVVMARFPEKGKTKTRLARTIGDDEALHLYRAFLIDLAQRFADQEDFELYWAYAPTEANYASFMATLVPSLAKYMRYFPQEGADLGMRLHAVFKEMQKRAFHNTVVIGSDVPHIDRDIVANARKAFDEADVVLGPADDGGYYLIALREPYDVFSGIPMSTDGVMQMTMNLAHRQGLKVHLLQPLFDVDEITDLLRLAELLEKDSSLAPTTATYLTRIRSLYDDYSNTGSYAATLDLHRAHQSM